MIIIKSVDRERLNIVIIVNELFFIQRLNKTHYHVPASLLWFFLVLNNHKLNIHFIFLNIFLARHLNMLTVNWDVGAFHGPKYYSMNQRNNWLNNQ